MAIRKYHEYFVIFKNNKDITTMDGCHFAHYYYKYIEWINHTTNRIYTYYQKYHKALTEYHCTKRHFIEDSKLKDHERRPKFDEKYSFLDNIGRDSKVVEILCRLKCFRKDKKILKGLLEQYENDNCRYNYGIVKFSECSRRLMKKDYPEKVKVKHHLCYFNIEVQPVFISYTNTTEIKRYIDDCIDKLILQERILKSFYKNNIDIAFIKLNNSIENISRKIDKIDTYNSEKLLNDKKGDLEYFVEMLEEKFGNKK